MSLKSLDYVTILSAFLTECTTADRRELEITRKRERAYCKRHQVSLYLFFLAEKCFVKTYGTSAVRSLLCAFFYIMYNFQLLWNLAVILVALLWRCLLISKQYKNFNSQSHRFKHLELGSYVEMSCAQIPDIFFLVDAAWKYPKYPCFCILPLEFFVNIDINMKTVRFYVQTAINLQRKCLGTPDCKTWKTC